MLKIRVVVQIRIRQVKIFATGAVRAGSTAFRLYAIAVDDVFFYLTPTEESSLTRSSSMSCMLISVKGGMSARARTSLMASSAACALRYQGISYQKRRRTRGKLPGKSCLHRWSGQVHAPGKWWSRRSQRRR